MLVGGQASVKLLSHETFAEFSHLPMADPTTRALALFCFDVASRDEVDKVAAAALAAGGTEADGAEELAPVEPRQRRPPLGHGRTATGVRFESPRDSVASHGNTRPHAHRDRAGDDRGARAGDRLRRGRRRR
jgi:hypothetical protein